MVDTDPDRDRGRSSGYTRRDDYRRDETSECDSSGRVIVSSYCYLADDRSGDFAPPGSHC